MFHFTKIQKKKNKNKRVSIMSEQQNQINVEIVGKIIGINVKPEIEYTLLVVVFSGTVRLCLSARFVPVSL